jgi:hypothetical protein
MKDDQECAVALLAVILLAMWLTHVITENICEATPCGRCGARPNENPSPADYKMDDVSPLPLPTPPGGVE